MKKTFAIVLVIVLFASIATFSASAAQWKTGNFGSGYTTVKLDNPKKDGYIKIHTYNCIKGNHSGQCFGAGETYAKLKVTFRDTKGKWICDFNTTSGTKLKLGKDHSAYRIYITCRQDLGSGAKNFENKGKCTHWAIETTSNTKF